MFAVDQHRGCIRMYIRRVPDTSPSPVATSPSRSEWFLDPSDPCSTPLRSMSHIPEKSTCHSDCPDIRSMKECNPGSLPRLCWEVSLVTLKILTQCAHLELFRTFTFIYLPSVIYLLYFFISLITYVPYIKDIHRMDKSTYLRPISVQNTEQRYRNDKLLL